MKGKGRIKNGKYVTEPVDADWAMLPFLTDEFQRARDIASAMYEKSVEEVCQTGESAALAPGLSRLYSSGYVQKDYYGNTRIATYALTDLGRKTLQDAQFQNLLTQAA